MYHLCTTKKTVLQQKLFVETLFEMLQEHMYQDITIIDLCKRAGLSRNIFYRLYDCKDDVLYLLIDQAFYECSQCVTSNEPRENLHAFYAFWKTKYLLLKLLDKNQLGPLLSTRGTLCCLHLDFGLHKYIHNDWSQYQVEILSFYTSGFIGLLFYWYHSDFSRSIEEMVDMTFQVLSKPPITFLE